MKRLVNAATTLAGLGFAALFLMETLWRKTEPHKNSSVAAIKSGNGWER